MRDRLIELLLKCEKENDVLSCYNERPRKVQAAEIIADHLLANGVIVPPCKVGDVVWWTDGCTRFAHKVEVTRISYTAEYGFDMSGFTRNQTHKMFNERDIGKTVFLAREEAEKALERSGDERN